MAEIDDVVDVELVNEAQYQIEIAAETDFSNPVALTEIQAIINRVNNSEAAIVAILESSSSVGGGISSEPLSSDVLTAITGLTSVITENVAAYNALIEAETDFSNPPSLVEIQSIIDEANTSVIVLAEVLEDSASEGGANNVNGSAVRAEQLALISCLLYTSDAADE